MSSLLVFLISLNYFLFPDLLENITDFQHGLRLFIPKSQNTVSCGFYTASFILHCCTDDSSWLDDYCTLHLPDGPAVSLETQGVLHSLGFEGCNNDCSTIKSPNGKQKSKENRIK